MKTTNSILLSAALIVGSAFFTGCQKSDNAKKASETTANSNSESVAIPKIAFVEVDSILSSYQFCVDHSKILEKKGANIQATLSSFPAKSTTGSIYIARTSCRGTSILTKAR